MSPWINILSINFGLIKVTFCLILSTKIGRMNYSLSTNIGQRADVFVLSKSPPLSTITTTITYKQVLNVTLVVIIVMAVLLHKRSFHLMVQ